MRLRIGLVTTLALLTALVAGASSSSSAPGGQCRRPLERGRRGRDLGPDAAGHRPRPPASSTRSQRWCTGRCTTRSRRSTAASSRSPPASAHRRAPPPTRRSPRPHGTSSSRASPPRRGRSRTRTTRSWRAFRPGRRRTRQGGRGGLGGRDARMRIGDHFDDAVHYVQPAPGPGVFEPIAPTPPVDVKLGVRAAVHLHRCLRTGRIRRTS